VLAARWTNSNAAAAKIEIISNRLIRFDFYFINFANIKKKKHFVVNSVLKLLIS
jgi:hypothetical protein